MKRFCGLSMMLFLAILLMTPALALGGWVKACNGQIPQGAAPQGNEASGEALWIARSRVTTKGSYMGTHIGKVRPGFNSAKIPYGGRELDAKCYEVWVGPTKWIRASNGQIPPGAIPCGEEANGQHLFVARGMVKGGLHIGKVRPGFGGANIPYGGKEVQVNVYEVLCR